MARPKKIRRIKFNPSVTYFKPRAVPLSILEDVSLDRDELETIRLVDFEHKTQTEAAKEMNVSQSTLQRIIINARNKIAEALIKGKAIKVENMLE